MAGQGGREQPRGGPEGVSVLLLGSLTHTPKTVTTLSRNVANMGPRKTPLPLMQFSLDFPIFPQLLWIPRDIDSESSSSGYTTLRSSLWAALTLAAVISSKLGKDWLRQSSGCSLADTLPLRAFSEVEMGPVDNGSPSS